MKVRILQLVTVIAALGAWELVARMGWVDPLFVPAPSAVAAALFKIGRGALAGLADTLGKTAVAYVLSVVLGVSAWCSAFWESSWSRCSPEFAGWATCWARTPTGFRPPSYSRRPRWCRPRRSRSSWRSIT